jgi:RimJ/RimL family protein N-acetyltransferase
MESQETLSGFTRIETDRLVLRRLVPSDAAVMFEYRSHPDVSRYQGWAPASADEILAFIDSLQKAEPAPGKWFQLGIALREPALLIGDCGVHLTAGDPRQAEIGITLMPSFQGRGLASEALRALLGHLFNQLKVHRAFGSVDPRNQASMALLARCGLRQEAHLVESYWFKGAWADDVIFALLEREWMARHP